MPVVHELPDVGRNLQDHFQVRAVYELDGLKSLNTDVRNPFKKMMMGIQYGLTRRGPLTISAAQAFLFARTRPELATVRRFWPNEPDQHGYLLRTGDGWALSYAPGDADDERIYRLDAHSIAPGSYLTLTEPDGTRLPFLVRGLAAA